MTLGHGTHQYDLDTEWSNADPATHPVKDCHEMVQVEDGRLFMLTNHKKNNMLIYEPDGSLAGSWTLGLGGAHGLSLDPKDPKALWLTDTGGKVMQVSLDGKVLNTLPTAQAAGAYNDRMAYRPTETAIGPDGDVYVADGYGSQHMLRFGRDGSFKQKFGRKSSLPTNAGTFLQAHGVAIDNRGEGDPLVVCTARIRNELHWFTLDGKWVKTVYLPGAYISRPVIAGDLLVSGVCFGAKPGDHRMWMNRGYVLILDKDNNPISAPGGNEPAYVGEGDSRRLDPLLQAEGSPFKNCHDVCVDRDGSLYVCQWNSGNVYPYKLTLKG